MQTLPFLCILALVTVAACSSSGGGAAVQDAGPATTAPSPALCTTAEDCNPDQCVCTDGQTSQAATLCSQGTCSSGQIDTFCAAVCKAHGGVSSIRPSPNVAATAECDAWCNKGAALGCGSPRCQRYFFCGVSKSSCEAAKRAALKCAVDQGTWACSAQSSSWSVTSSCPTFSELCASTTDDAGTD